MSVNYMQIDTPHMSVNCMQLDTFTCASNEIPVHISVNYMQLDTFSCVIKLHAVRYFYISVNYMKLDIFIYSLSINSRVVNLGTTTKLC